MIVKLFDAVSFSSDKDHTPLIVHQTETDGMAEDTYMFKLDKNRQYFVILYYSGEQLYRDSKPLCDYYNLFVSINTVGFLRQELACLP